MNTLQMMYFLATAKNKSFSKTAAEYYITQPSLSKHIKNLETELEVELFDRTKTPVELTAIGNVYYKLFSEYMNELQRVKRLSKDETEVFSSTLRIGIISGCKFPEKLRQAMFAFHKQYPTIQILYENHDHTKLIQKLKNKSLDVCFTFQDFVTNLSDISSQTLFCVKKNLAFSERLFDKPYENISISDISNQTFFVVGEDSGNQILEFMINYCSDYNFYPKIRTLPNIESVMTNVAFGNGVTIIDELTQFNETPDIKKIEIQPGHTLSLAWHNIYLTPEVNILKSFLIDYSGEHKTLYNWQLI